MAWVEWNSYFQFVKLVSFQINIYTIYISFSGVPGANRKHLDFKYQAFFRNGNMISVIVSLQQNVTDGRRTLSFAKAFEARY